MCTRDSKDATSAKGKTAADAIQPRQSVLPLEERSAQRSAGSREGNASSGRLTALQQKIPAL